MMIIDLIYRMQKMGKDVDLEFKRLAVNEEHTVCFACVAFKAR